MSAVSFDRHRIRVRGHAAVLRAAVFVALLMAACNVNLAHAADVKTVENFRIEQYLGTWHEIAAIPQFFQRKCIRDTKAVYSVESADLIRVENACLRIDGGRESIEGRARGTDPGNTARLEVTFLRLFDEYRFWAAGDYWVLAVDPAYRWAVVGHPSRKYGWVLARQPLLPSATLSEIIGRIKSQGYDACEFVVTPQTGGMSVRRPLCDALP